MSGISLVRHFAQAFVRAAGFDLAAVDIKVKESPACRRRQTDRPAYDVWVRPHGASRGRQVGTVIFDVPGAA
jgi:hypothetical protein